MASVGGAFALPGNRERLTGTRTSPDGSVVGPACKPQGKAPSSDACEEVALNVPHKVSWLDIGDTPFVDVSRRDVAGVDELTQPRGSFGVVLVVVGRHPVHPLNSRATREKSQLRCCAMEWWPASVMMRWS